MTHNVLKRCFSLSTKDFKKIYKLGEGANSKVYNVISLNNKKMYTYKEYHNNNIDKINKEIEILKSIKTKNNVLPKYYKTIIGENKVCVLTDFIEGKELFEKYCFKKDNILTEETIKPVLKQMVGCIEECNKNNIIHMDIKPENFIISHDDKISLIDFGSSQFFNNKNKIYNLNSSKIGTLSYCSPEVLYRNIYHINSDIWSLGVCIYGLLENKKLFNEHEINNPKKNYKYFNTFTLELQDLLQQIFVIYPEERISLEEIKKHPFIKG